MEFEEQPIHQMITEIKGSGRPLEANMKKVDTSDWSIAVVDLGSHLFYDMTLESESDFRSFCEQNGYRLGSFKKGTNKYYIINFL